MMRRAAMTMALVGLVVLAVAQQARGGPVGPPCTGCADGFYYTPGGCVACGNGGANYACAAGSYQSGTACQECVGESDTQTCAVCGNGGATYQCPAGAFKTGSACSGTSSTDTQTCARTAAALSNHNAVFLGAGLLLAGMWSARRLARR